MWLLICYLYRDVCYLRDVCTNFIVLNHARRNQSGRSGHGPTKISAERTSLQGYRYSCGRLDGGVVRLLERGLKRSCVHARQAYVARQMQVHALQLSCPPLPNSIVRSSMKWRCPRLYLAFLSCRGRSVSSRLLVQLSQSSYTIAHCQRPARRPC